jgi:hypothetical protein
MSHAHSGNAVARVPFLPPLPTLQLGRSHRPILRHRRRSFHPTVDASPYRLPKAVHDRLTASLAPFRNAETSYALAVFLGRYWSSETRLEDAFPIDRRALSNHKDLDLTEARVRGAIETLERIGFLERALVPKASGYRLTENGLRRQPILYVFGDGYRDAFRAANNRPRHQEHRKRQPVPTSKNPPRRSILQLPARSLSRPPPRAFTPIANSPKNISKKTFMLMGWIPDATAPQSQGEHSRLEDAIDRLRQAGNFK